MGGSRINIFYHTWVAYPVVTVFIISWERPIYLWVCLDALYRFTRHPHRFILLDNHSSDPLVPRVIDAFIRRQMFHAVHRMPRNDPRNLNELLDLYDSQLGDYVACVESDVVVEPIDRGCWLGEMINLCEANPRLAMLGSYSEITDFVPLEAARALYPTYDDERVRALVKADSPERSLAIEPPSEPIISPFNPPGRLTLWRTEPLRETGFLSDVEAHRSLIERGWQTGISTGVRHRHLSLLHAYDEPMYDVVARDAFFSFSGREPTKRPRWGHTLGTFMARLRR